MSDDCFRLPPARVALHQDVFGQRRTFAGLSLVEWLFLCVSCTNIFIAIGLTTDRLIIATNDDDSFDFTYSLLLLINAFFCVFYVFNGILRERQYEIYAFVGAIMLVLTYCISEYILNVEGRNIIKLARLIVGSILAPINIGLAVLVARQFGWLEFRIVGAAEALQLMYRQLCFFMSMQRFDLQASASFIILVVKNTSNLTLEEKLTLGIGMPLLIICFVIGFYGVLHEIKCLIYPFIIVSLAEPGYVIYKLVNLYMGNSGLNRCSNMLTTACIHWYTTMGIGFLTLLVRGMVFYELCYVYKNFGYGLKERGFARLVQSERTSLLGRQRRKLFL